MTRDIDALCELHEKIDRINDKIRILKNIKNDLYDEYDITPENLRYYIYEKRIKKDTPEDFTQRDIKYIKQNQG